MSQAIDPATLPPNIQAILRKPSPSSAHLGLEFIDCDPAKGRIRVAYQASDQLCNLWGGIHGGMVAAMMDDVLALVFGLTLQWGQITPTLELKTTFLQAARPGRLYAEAFIIRRGRSISFAEAELRSETGELLAKASATASIVTLKPKDSAKA
ncbi:MAG: PaaI family thioesterase [Alphaproteobacteria bacterium]|nr:PaaI family thioesterase [Alphaproteobacteria bacterium]